MGARPSGENNRRKASAQLCEFRSQSYWNGAGKAEKIAEGAPAHSAPGGHGLNFGKTENFFKKILSFFQKPLATPGNVCYYNTRLRTACEEHPFTTSHDMR